MVSPSAQFAICLFNGAASLGITFANKFLFSTQGFKFPLVLLLLQYICNVVICEFCRTFWPNDKPKDSLWTICRLPDFSWKDLNAQLKVMFITVANVLCAFFGLKLVNVPMFIALRRLNTCQMYIYDTVVMKKPIEKMIFTSVSLMTLGIIIAAVSDLTADLFGYLFVISNNILTVLQYQWQKKISDESSKLNAMAQTYYISLAAILPLCFVYYYFESFTISDYQFKYETPFLTSLTLSSIGGFLIVLSINMNNTINSPMTVMVTGESKNIVGTVLGLLVFGDVIWTPQLLFGLGLSLVGSCLYAYAKYQQSVGKAPASPPAATSKVDLDSKKDSSE